MYTLMNKNEPLIDFEFARDSVGELEVVEKRCYTRPWFIKDLHNWLHDRFASRNRKNIEELFWALGLHDLKSKIDFTRGLSLTDTLWINCNDRFEWDKISLFSNEFDEVITRLAFDGMPGDLHQTLTRELAGIKHTVSPEFTTDGMFAKCWVRESDGIYLMKQGSGDFASNSGLEPYSEQYCSEVLDWLGYNHVEYRAVKFRGQLASKCRLLTSEDRMMVPLKSCLGKSDLKSVLEFCKKYGIEKDMYKTLVFDYLVTNDDRHLNNIGVLLDTDTFYVKGLAPIFDNGAGLLPYATARDLESYETQSLYASGKAPRFYSDFFGAARLALEGLRDVGDSTIGKLLDFKFRRDYELQLPVSRVAALEEYIRGQTRNLLEDIDPAQLARQSKLDDFGSEAGRTSLFI